jgi:NAD(P)-dependent dehydrogenase (short-subunit alcohol dehydrogenase family)
MTKGAINVMSQTLENALGTLGITVNAVMQGPADPYLNPDLARHLAGLFRHADLHLVRGASHWPQWDQPELVARLIIQAAASDPGALLP